MRSLTLVPLVAATAMVVGCGSKTERADVTVSGDTAIIRIDSVECAGCAMTVGSPVRIGATTDREIPRRVPTMLRDGRGTIYLVFNGWGDKPILRYDSTGRYLGRIGATGRGPGEYEMTHGAFMGPGDSLWVDSGFAATLVFAPDGSFARSFVAPTRHPIGVGTDGTIYATGAASAFTHAGRLSIHRMSPDGTPRDSFQIFGRATGQMTVLNRGRRDERTVERWTQSEPFFSADGSVWTYTPVYARLEHHAATGVPTQLFGLARAGGPPAIIETRQMDSLGELMRNAKIKTVDRNSPEYEKLRRTPRARTYFMSGTDGLVWIVRAVAAPSWDTIRYKADRLAPDEAPEEETIPRDVEDRLYHTIIEVFDPKQARIIGRTTLPFFGVPAAPGFIGRVTADDDGYYVVSMYPVRLRRED